MGTHTLSSEMKGTVYFNRLINLARANEGAKRTFYIMMLIYWIFFLAR